MTDNSAVASVKAAKAPWSRGKKWAVGGASTFAALWAMGTVSDAVGPDTIIETVTTTVTETPPAVTETQTVVETTIETQTVTEEAPAPLTKAPETMAPSSAPAPTAAPPRAHYPNCTAVRAAGAAPIYRGEPGYSSSLDRDGDGVACEK